MRLAQDIGNPLTLFVPFSKHETLKDGTVVVEGIATMEEIDKQGEIVEYNASVRAFTEWADGFSRATNGRSQGNIREMHGPVAAGKAIGWAPDPARKAITLRARIVDEEAAKKVRESVYTGFSIGAPGSSVTRETKKIGDDSVQIITGYRLSEVSIVDNPACPSALFQVVKRASDDAPTVPASPVEPSADPMPASDPDPVVETPPVPMPSETETQHEPTMPDASAPAEETSVASDSQPNQVIGHTEMPPVPQTGSNTSKNFGMDNVARLANVVSCLNDVIECCEMEEQMEGEAPPYLAKIKSAAGALADALVELTEHEAGEMNATAEGDNDMELAAKIEKLEAVIAKTVTKDDIDGQITKAVTDSLAPLKEQIATLATSVETIAKAKAAIGRPVAPVDKQMTITQDDGTETPITKEDLAAAAQEMVRKGLVKGKSAQDLLVATATMLTPGRAQ